MRDPQTLHYVAQLRERNRSMYDHLAASPHGARFLEAIFANSRFLAESVVAHPEWAHELAAQGYVEHSLSRDQMRSRLEASISPGVPAPVELARFRRRQLLRIVLRDALEIATLPEITGGLTLLADIILEVVYERIYQHLAPRYGEPLSEDGSLAHFAILALGKMGGEELNYSSDIDLMFLYSANGETCGPQRISNREFFKRAANQLTHLLSAYTPEGMCYRVDLRLRPDGSLGEVCMPLEGACRYYAERARDWELQMLIKARTAAGHKPTGDELLNFVATRIYATSTDFTAIEQLSATRERLTEKLNAKSVRLSPGINVKLARGGIRDIEFMTQCLQRLHGGAEPWVQHHSTLLALARLHDKGVLSEADYGRLAAAYQFLRHLEHRLQFDEDRQTHTLPTDPEALDRIARHMPGHRLRSTSLLTELRNHLKNVTGLYERIIHAGQQEPAQGSDFAPPKLLPFTEQQAPTLAVTVAHTKLPQGAEVFEHFLTRLAEQPDVLNTLDRDPELVATTLDLFSHSPHFGEELIRHPEFVLELERPADEWIHTVPPRTPAELRRWYRRGILRIAANSICRSHPVFDTLTVTSDLADAVIASAYKIAIEETLDAHPPQSARYRPVDQMFVIALGRLGMREFDLASDADLTFVLAEDDTAELAFWTRVAERIVQLISAYTGEGVLFTVDTRLRPNGSAGLLVHTETAVLDYFAVSAEAWESITYLKARTVAGNRPKAERFLHDLQQVYGDRYGQHSRVELREMRARLEREQGSSRPLKAGRGGYYDIDFLLLYLRLKNAGIYYSYLNTPARIEVLETTEKLSHADAQFLRRAATFYRAVDHGMRVLTGLAADKLPHTGAQLEALDALLKRWTPVAIADLERIQEETRALFDRFFY